MLLRLLAPTLPFVTEEIWRWWRDGSVHAQRWPEPSGRAGPAAILDHVSELLSQVRRAKTDAKVSQRAAVARLVVRGPIDAREAISVATDDLRDAAGSITSIELLDGPELSATIELAPSTDGAPAP